MNCEAVENSPWRQVVTPEEYNQYFQQAAREVLTRYQLKLVFDRTDFLIRRRKDVI